MTANLDGVSAQLDSLPRPPTLRRLCVEPGPTLSKLLRKILGRFLILGQSSTISGKAITRHNFALFIIN